MKRKPAKRSSLFLMELIIAILFFCLASAVCVRFFVKSHLIERDTTALNHAANYASSVAEMYLCYELQSSTAAPMSLVPAWCIVTDTVNYYVNCASGAVSQY